jgi:hypothetical protein
MRRLRFSIGQILLLVLFLACGLAALRASSDLADATVFALTLGLLLLGTLLAVHRLEKRRAYWLGFALFGATYLGVSLIPPLEARLPTSTALHFLDSKIPGRGQTYSVVLTQRLNTQGAKPVQNAVTVTGTNLSYTVAGSGMLQMQGPVTLNWLSTSNGTTENFVRVGHSLLALVMAYLGGHLSRYLYGKGRQPAQEGDQPEPDHRADQTA